METIHAHGDKLVDVAPSPHPALHHTDRIVSQIGIFPHSPFIDLLDIDVVSNVSRTHRNRRSVDDIVDQDNTRKRKVLKVVRRKPKMIEDDHTETITENTPPTTPIRRRIAITRKREHTSSIPAVAPTKKLKKIIKSKKIFKEEVSSIEPSRPPLPAYTPTPIILTTSTLLYDTVTTTTTRQRTYTFIVTRVNDKDSIVMSSTSVKDHVGPTTQTITRTISLTITIPPIQQTQSYLL